MFEIPTFSCSKFRLFYMIGLLHSHFSTKKVLSCIQNCPNVGSKKVTTQLLNKNNCDHLLLLALLIILVKFIPFRWIFSIQIIINVNRIVETLSPSQYSFIGFLTSISVRNCPQSSTMSHDP